MMINLQSALPSAVGGVLAVLLTLGAPAMVTARPTATLNPSADTTLYSENGGLSNGAGEHIFVGNTNGSLSTGTRRALVKFDLSSLPSDAIVSAVSLKMTMSRAGSTTSYTVGLYKATNDWGEGGSNAGSEEGQGTAATTNDATWTHRFFNSTFWTTAGGDAAAAASATLGVAGLGDYTWSGAGLVSDVQGWITSPATNRGWLIKGVEVGLKTTKRFASRQNPTFGSRPLLSITYTSASIPGRCCLPDGTCTVISLSACTTQGGSFGGQGTTCTGCTCPGPVGACCANSGICTQVTYCQCLAAGGTFKGAGALCANTYCSPQLTPYLDPLPIPAVLPPTTVFGDHDYYSIAMREVSQTLHSQLPATKVWGYNGVFPGPTIKAEKGRPVRVKWINDLHNTAADEPQLRANHYLPVDTCLHGMDPFDLRPRTVVHLHGGKVEAGFDGQPDAAFPPGSNSGDYWYYNDQRAATLWYHDHALGLTRLNVYMGLAGYYLIHDPAEDALTLPSGYYDIPLCIQDRSFNADGTLRYTGTSGAQEEFFGDKILVNGKVWPYLQVAQGKYRFRLLNGSNSRTYKLSVVSGGSYQVPWWQIGTDQGLLPAPVELAPIGQQFLILQPGERADVVIDFANVPGFGAVYLRNSAPAPYPGTAGVGVISNVMLFSGVFTSGYTAPLPATLSTITPIPEQSASATRDWRLRTSANQLCGHPTWLINDLLWDDITDFLHIGTTEVWTFTNQSAITHPMHVHLIKFQVLNRQAFTNVGGNPVPTGPLLPPSPTEGGWKDTVQCPPNQITKVIATFDGYPGLFPLHCHLLEHEDHEMMRQYQVLCDPVSFLGNTASVFINVGQTAHFQVVAFGDALSFQWYRNGVALTDGPTAGGSVISGAQTDHLIITSAASGPHYHDDDPCYFCAIGNPCSHAISDCIGLFIDATCAAGDINGDYTTNTADLTILLGVFGQPVDPFTGGDLTGDGFVNTADLTTLLGAYGSSCR